MVAKRAKYRNVKTTIDGIEFDSLKEGRRYKELKLLEKAGEISHLELQPKFFLVINGESVRGENGHRLYYKGDFAYFDGTKRIVEDVKGMKTPVYRLKKQLVERMYPAVKIVEV